MKGERGAGCPCNPLTRPRAEVPVIRPQPSLNLNAAARRKSCLASRFGLIVGGLAACAGMLGREGAQTAEDASTSVSRLAGRVFDAARVRSIWREPRPVPIAIRDGAAEFEVPAHAGPTLVVVATLARGAGPKRVTLRARPTDLVRPPRLAADLPRHLPEVSAGEHPAVAARSLPTRPRADQETASESASRPFWILVQGDDPAHAGSYRRVEADRRAMGSGCEVYVDRDDAELVSDAAAGGLARTFDNAVDPLTRALLGADRLPRVDGGRFTILLTRRVRDARLGQGAVDGFVRAADFDANLAPPFGNRRDMLTLNSALPDGAYPRTLLAHEYAHAMLLMLKRDGRAGIGASRDEEGWLDEAIAHVVEDAHGYSRANLDHRVSAYLSRPERYPLVVEDYHAAGLFRSHGCRGATYLFLRWCVDRYGEGLPAALARSSLRGVANLEAATGSSFDDLFRRWSVALFMSGLEPGRKQADDFSTLNPRGPFDDWELAGPWFASVEPDDAGGAIAWTSQPTSVRYVVVEPSKSAGRGVSIAIASTADAGLQVTAVPLPASMSRLNLQARARVDANGRARCDIEINERGGTPIRLSSLAWEPLSPGADPAATRAAHGSLDVLGIARACGTSALPARGRLVGRNVELGKPPTTGPMILKVIGTDARGRRVAAWAEVEVEPQTRHAGPIASGGTPPA